MNPGYPPYSQQQMPQPAQYPLYPPSGQTSAPYPGQVGFTAGYPPQSGGYPPQPQPSSYPPQPSSYPPQPQIGSYPQQPQSGSYPPQPQSGSYPPQPQSGSYPSQPQSGGYPPQPSSYPLQTGGYPTQSLGAYPPQSQASGYPSQPSYAPQPGHQSAAYPSQGSYAGTGASYPAATSMSYPSAPAASYPPAVGSAHSTSQSSYPSASAPSSYPPQSAAGSLYPTQSMQPAHTASYTTHSMHASSNMEQLSPTVKPASPFNPQADAEILRKAMKGFGTDEKAIINVLTKRSNQQRLDIAVNFKTMYGKDLIADLKSELSGKFEDLIIALMKPLPEFLASEIRHAIEGFGTNEQTLVEILCTASNAEINTIKAAYQRLFGQSLENDLRGDTSGNFKRLLVSVVQGRRSENYNVDEAAAIRDAQSLMTAGVLRIGTDESTFNAILCSRSYPHLRRVLMEYQRISGKPLEHAIRSEFSGDIEIGLLAIIQSVEDKSGFFAERIHDAVACVGTKDRQLIRVVVSRCEIDMQSIKRAYQQRYGKSVEQDISNDTSGDYKKTLLALVSGGHY